MAKFVEIARLLQSSEITNKQFIEAKDERVQSLTWDTEGLHVVDRVGVEYLIPPHAVRLLKFVAAQPKEKK